MDYSKMKKAELLKELEAIKKLSTQLKTAKTKAKNARQALDAVNKEMTILTAQLKKNEKLLKEEKSARGKSNERLKKAQKELEELARKHKAHAEETTEKRKKESVENKKVQAELKRQIESLDKVAEKRAAELEQIKKQVETQIPAQEKINEELKKRCGQLEKVLAERTGELNLAKQEFEKQLAESKQVETQIPAQEKINEELKKRCGELEKVLAERTGELNLAKQEFEKQLAESKQVEKEAIKQCELLNALLEERTADLKGAKELLQEEIARRREAEKEQHVSEEKSSGPKEKKGNIVFSFDPRFKVLSISPSVEEILGHKPEEVIGKTLYELDILPQESLECVFNNMDKILEGEKKHIAEFKLGAKDGGIRHSNLALALLPKESDTPIVACVARDISEPGKAGEPQYELEPQKLFIRELRKLDPVKSEFASVVKSEISTPIVLLNSAVKMFLDGVLGDTSEEQNKMLEMMGKNMEKLLQFATEIMQLAKADAKKKT